MIWTIHLHGIMFQPYPSSGLFPLAFFQFKLPSAPLEVARTLDVLEHAWDRCWKSGKFPLRNIVWVCQLSELLVPWEDTAKKDWTSHEVGQPRILEIFGRVGGWELEGCEGLKSWKLKTKSTFWRMNLPRLSDPPRARVDDSSFNQANFRRKKMQFQPRGENLPK